jgi:hypothetical protein
MRLVILTDSLGYARDEINVNDTWTDRILREFKEVVIYEISIGGLTMSKFDMNRLKYLEGDALICQVGIVDANRRAFRRKEVIAFSSIPVVGKVIHKIAKKHHYTLTKIRNIHYCNLPVFKRRISELCNYIKGECFFVEIAPPGRALVEQVYHVSEDVEAYNEAITSLENEKIHVLRPYSDSQIENPNEFLLEDGHHLNLLGEELVYQAVKKAIQSLLCNMDIEINKKEDI